MSTIPRESLTIERLIYGGEGLARSAGLVWFIPYSAVGDILQVEETERKPSYRRGRISTILQPSPDRTAPRCPHFSRCGGCQWQHIHYTAQITAKEDILKYMAEKAGFNDLANLRVKPSPVEFGYRSRITLHRQAGGIGYFESGSRNLIAISDCPIAVEPIRNWLKSPPLPVSELKRLPERFELRADTSGGISILTDPAEGPFSQANSEGNILLQKKIQERILHYHEKPRIFDLFCGDGNLSLPLAEQAQSIRGWDSSARAIEKAAQAAQHYPQAKYRVGDVGRISGALKESAADVDVLIVDPPRGGIKKEAALLARLKVPTIVYVSCNPATLMRDLQSFVNGGYRIKHIEGFDMFPQTYHLECVALLRLED